MCGGGGGAPPPPPPDPSEVALNKEYLNLLQETRSQQQALTPLLLGDAGYKATYGPNEAITDFNKAKGLWTDPANLQTINWKGKDYSREDFRTQIYGPAITRYSKEGANVITGYEKTPERAATEQRYQELQTQVDAATKRGLELYGLEATRQERALKGELPVSEGTVQRKSQEFAALKEAMARSGNPIIGDDPDSAYSLTTSGAQTLDLFQKKYKLAEDAERQGQIAQGTSNLTQTLGLGANIASSNYARNTGATSGLVNSVQGANLSLLPAYLQGQQPYQFQRGMQNQTNQMNAQIDAQNRAGWMSLIGTGIGSGAALALSDRRSKKKIKKVSAKEEGRSLKRLSKTPLYRWNYKSEPDGAKQHFGTMTQDAPDEVVSSDGRHLDITSYLGLLTGAVKDLNRKVEGLSLRG